MSTFGDGRLTILGTDGYIELRKNVDIGGRAGGDHRFLVDQNETQRINCADVTLQLALEAQKAARGLVAATGSTSRPARS